MRSAAIMAHPARKSFVSALRRGALRGVPVVWDEHGDRWDTGRRSMLAYDPGETWHLVVQDDAVPCKRFLAGVDAALAHVDPVRPVAFYTGQVRPAHDDVAKSVAAAERLGRSWLEFSGPWWGVAVAVPVHMIDAMIEWGDAHPGIANYDKRMARYFDSIGVKCWYSYPSLVDHRVGDENPSLVPGRGNGASRVAFRFIGDESPLDVDWSTGPALESDRVSERSLTIREKRAATAARSRTWRHRFDGRLRTTLIGSAQDVRYGQFPDEWEVI